MHFYFIFDDEILFRDRILYDVEGTALLPTGTKRLQSLYHPDDVMSLTRPRKFANAHFVRGNFLINIQFIP